MSNLFTVPEGETLRSHLLKIGKIALEQAMIPMKVRKDKHAVAGWILKKEDEADKMEIEIVELQSASELKPDAILDAIDSLSILKERIKDGKELYKKLFGEDYKD